MRTGRISCPSGFIRRHLGFFSGTLLLLTSSAAQTAENLDLDKTTIDLQRTIEQARTCLPRQNPSGVQFCTGLRMTSQELTDFFRLDQDSCISRIQKEGFRTIRKNPVPSPEWLDFQASTKKALTLQDLRLVFFKPEANRIDCLHELLHILQWNSSSTESLAPKIRKNKIAQITAHLEAAITQVEKLEKAGKTSEAQHEADRLQPLLQALSNFGQLTDTLDEIEVHYLLYRNCQVLHCSEEDEEIALANLDRRRNFLPAELAKEVDAEVKKRTQAKFQPQIKRAVREWKPLSPGERSKASQLLSMDWKNLLHSLRKQKLRILGLDSSKDKALPSLFPKTAIPAKIFTQLEKPSSEDLSKFRKSKITEGGALGKFLCTLKDPTIILTPMATIGTAVHEYLHSLQSSKNSNYCAAISRQPEIAEHFSRGELKRADYENTVLYYQALNALAEKEVYDFLTSFSQQLEPLEVRNNEEMAKHYQEILSP
jgi:hypothetical protein